MEIELALAEKAKTRCTRTSKPVLVSRPSLSCPLRNDWFNRCLLLLKMGFMVDPGLVVGGLDLDAVHSPNFKRIVASETSLMTLRKIGLSPILLHLDLVAWIREKLLQARLLS